MQRFGQKLLNLLVFVAILFFTSFCFAQENESEIILTATNAVQFAIQGNLGLKQSDIDLQSAARSKKYSWNSVSPTLNASASFGTDLENDPSFTFGASASIALSPSIYTSIRSAAINYEQQKLTYDEAVRSVELNVLTAYYQILYEQENINLKKNSVESAKKQYETNLARYNRGALSRLDVLSAQVSYQNAELSLKVSQSTWDNDAASFKQMLGLPQDAKIRLSGSLSDVFALSEIPDLTSDDENPTLKSLELQIEAAKNALLATRFSAWGPSLTASYSYNFNVTSENGVKPVYDKGRLSLGLSIPLDGYLPWSNGAQSIQNQKDTLNKLELELQNTKTTLDVTVKNYLNQIKQSQETIKLRQNSIDLAQQTYDMTLDAYNHGTRDIISLQNASDSLVEAKVNLMSEAYTLVTAVLKLENTLGLEFGTLFSIDSSDSNDGENDSKK